MKAKSLISLLAGSCAALAGQQQDSLAQSSFLKFQSIAEEIPQEFPGIDSNAMLGTPLPMWSITEAMVSQYGTARILPDVDAPPAAYLYPVISGGYCRYFLRLDTTANGWSVRGLGFSDLAREVDSVGNAWPASAEQSIGIIESAPTLQYFFTILPGNTSNLTLFRFEDPLVQDTLPQPPKYETLESPEATLTSTQTFARR